MCATGWVRHCAFDSFVVRSVIFFSNLRAPTETILHAMEQEQQQQLGGPDINAADNDFLPVLTSETVQEPAAAAATQSTSTATSTTTTRPGSDGSSTRVTGAEAGAGAGADKISAGFSAGSLARTIALPAPRLERDFRMQARLEGKIALGQSCWGTRNWIGICGGEWSATWGKGTVVVSLGLKPLM